MSVSSRTGRGTAQQLDGGGGPSAGFGHLPSSGEDYGYEPLADELAAVVTYLEMRSPPIRPSRSPCPCSASMCPSRSITESCSASIGAPWLWFSRLTLDDAHLAAIIQHPKVELYSVVDETQPRSRNARARLARTARLRAVVRRPGTGIIRQGSRPLAARRSRATSPGARASTGSMSTPARSTTRRRCRLTAAPDLPRTSGRSSASPTRACSASCRGSARLRSRCSARPPERRRAGELDVNPREHHREQDVIAALTTASISASTSAEADIGSILPRSKPSDRAGGAPDCDRPRCLRR